MMSRVTMTSGIIFMLPQQDFIFQLKTFVLFSFVRFLMIFFIISFSFSPVAL